MTVCLIGFVTTEECDGQLPPCARARSAVSLHCASLGRSWRPQRRLQQLLLICARQVSRQCLCRGLHNAAGISPHARRQRSRHRNRAAAKQQAAQAAAALKQSPEPQRCGCWSWISPSCVRAVAPGAVASHRAGNTATIETALAAHQTYTQQTPHTHAAWPHRCAGAAAAWTIRLFSSGSRRAGPWRLLALLHSLAVAAASVRTTHTPPASCAASAAGKQAVMGLPACCGAARPQLAPRSRPALAQRAAGSVRPAATSLLAGRGQGLAAAGPVARAERACDGRGNGAGRCAAIHAGGRLDQQLALHPAAAAVKATCAGRSSSRCAAGGGGSVNVPGPWVSACWGCGAAAAAPGCAATRASRSITAPPRPRTCDDKDAPEAAARQLLGHGLGGVAEAVEQQHLCAAADALERSNLQRRHLRARQRTAGRGGGAAMAEHTGSVSERCASAHCVRRRAEGPAGARPASSRPAALRAHAPAPRWPRGRAAGRAASCPL